MKGESTGGRVRIGVLAALVVFGGAVAWLGQGQQALALAGATRHRMTKITETIYRADAPGTPGINATSWVFVNDADVLVTDSEGSPASAWSLAGGRQVDHRQAGEISRGHAFPHRSRLRQCGPALTVQIIGHEFSRKMLLGPEARQGVTFRNFTDPMPARIENLRKQVAAEADVTKKATLQQQLVSAEATLAILFGRLPVAGAQHHDFGCDVTLVRKQGVPDHVGGPGSHRRRSDCLTCRPSERRRPATSCSRRWSAGREMRSPTITRPRWTR